MSYLPPTAQEELVAQGLNNLANQLLREDHVASALALYRRAVRLAPGEYRWKANLAGALATEGYTQEALNLAKEVVAHAPDYYFGWSVYGFLCLASNLAEKAIACFNKAVELAPNNATCLLDQAYAYLAAGRWARGFELYEGRRHWRPERVFSMPRWQGDKDADAHVWGEQGFGDTINFARYIPWLAERCKSVTFAVPTALFTLLKGYERYGRVVTLEQHQPTGEEVALMSLPLLANTTPDNVPPDPGVLNVAMSSGAFGGGGKKVGLVWAGNKNHVRNRNRSVAFTDMLQLAANPALELYGLQVGERAADIAVHRAQSLVTDLSGVVEKDWCATAAVLKQLDALVTVDTSVAHLAGALGVKTALLVYSGGDWRWLLDRQDCVWYPSVTLFRQNQPGCWEDALQKVSRWLEDL